VHQHPGPRRPRARGKMVFRPRVHQGFADGADTPGRTARAGDRPAHGGGCSSFGRTGAFAVSARRIPKDSPSTPVHAVPSPATTESTFDILALLEARGGEAFALHERYMNPQMPRILRTIGFDADYVRAEGAWLYDRAGRRYLDFLAGFGAFALGRWHPAIDR